jgi:hypothetical protein
MKTTSAMLIGLALGAAGVAPAQVPVYTATAAVRVQPAPWTPVCAAPAPVVVAPRPVYVAPPPVYVAPAPVCVAPRPVVVVPAPARVVARPVHVIPSPVSVGIGFGFGGRGWVVGGFLGPVFGTCAW